MHAMRMKLSENELTYIFDKVLDSIAYELVYPFLSLMSICDAKLFNQMKFRHIHSETASKSLILK